MNYEVELKFPVSDYEPIISQLKSLSAETGGTQVQVDRYFAHPVRDFAATDEALRIRSIGDENRITYKGPVIDKATKTRHESELTFQSGAAAAEQLAQIWIDLGFRQVRMVRKSREHFRLNWQSRQLEVCLDQVEGLGNFLEIETLATDTDKAAAQRAILSLADALKLRDAERRSYLEMLLELDGQ